MDPQQPSRPRPRNRTRLVYRWDLDKTYLRTEFDTVRDLFRTAFESAAQKRTVPGAASLLRELSATEPMGVYIVSGSPESMRRVLEAKLRLDGIRWDGLTLKPQLRNLLTGRFRLLKDQVGYKLGALLENRQQLGREIDEYMFGDDAEADAFIYSFYADLCAGRVSADTLIEVLRGAGVYESDLPHLVRSAERVPRNDGCRGIFIHLDRVSSPSVFVEFGSRVCPFYNYFQPALVLLKQDAIGEQAALRVAAEMIIHHSFTADALVASYVDLVRRGHLRLRTAERLLTVLGSLEETHFATTYPTLMEFSHLLNNEVKSLEPGPRPAPVEIDYVGLLARDRARARSARKRLSGR